MILNNNKLFILPRLMSGSFNGLDRLDIPYNILILHQVLQREDNGDIELVCQAKDGLEEKRGKIRFSVDDRTKKNELFNWLRKQIGRDIETIYGSNFSFGGESI